VLSLYLPDLARFETTSELVASPLYQQLRPEIERTLSTVMTDSLASEQSGAPEESVRALAWNIERGIDVDGVVRALATHPDLKSFHVLMLSEVDLGMARTRNRFVVRDIAEALALNYAFAPCYLALNKGSGVELHCCRGSRCTAFIRSHFPTGKTR
jgi:hypothetical protein